MSSLKGARFGRLLVVEQSGTVHRHTQWKCACDCGGLVMVSRPNLTSGATKSCGCLRREVTAERSTTHGASRHDGTPEYESWCAMNARCSATSGRRKRDYVDRGIKICRRWASFDSFLADMGPRPSGKSLDRKNNNRGYSPSNCRWATPTEQRNNRRDKK